MTFFLGTTTTLTTETTTTPCTYGEYGTCMCQLTCDDIKAGRLCDSIVYDSEENLFYLGKNIQFQEMLKKLTQLELLQRSLMILMFKYNWTPILISKMFFKVIHLITSVLYLFFLRKWMFHLSKFCLTRFSCKCFCSVFHSGCSRKVLYV